MRTAVQNANHLKERGDELMPRGPLVEVTFTGDGPIGMHIVNISTLDSEGNKGFDRVVVASAAEGAQAENRIFFGEQVIQVGDVQTKGMKMKEVKLMIADAERPVKIILQPLCFRSTRDDDFPMCPPMPSTFHDSRLLWGLVSRSYALEALGPERRVRPNSYVDYISSIPDFVFVRSNKGNESLIEEGERILEVDGRRDKLVLEGLLRAEYPGAEIVVQKVHVTGIITCRKCKEREWIFSLYCSHCGAPQPKRRW